MHSLTSRLLLLLALALPAAGLTACGGDDDDCATVDPSGAAADCGSQCTPGVDPDPACSLNECTYGRNACGGIVYSCNQEGQIEEGHCDPSPADASEPDAGEPDAADSIACTPGVDPHPGCSSSDCTAGLNACDGTIYDCSSDGHIVISICDPPQPDAGSARAPAAP